MVATISAFTPPSSSISSTSTRTQQFQLSAVPSPERLFDYSKKPPTFNKQTTLWEPSHETEDAPYGPWGSFLRGGPSPFLVRVLQPSDYEQAVFKYMAQTSCSRAEAQGNMDAFFNNAADWAYQKSEEARGRPKVDYTQLKLKDAILVITWAVFVTPFLGRCAYLIAATDAGWGITVDDIFNF
eukprot:CAMPEP_0201735154 /NCGR_PEP_ID=MMETSP0593-20130828/36275_1 /ASSEMBLY_ACC=CAM_ASM_000672 /TAXON_ID=267983 /ORGANISM="Skeletonema japonicum, Strain CCMP2506" /LENGTH=182 /DNA_ID=CAMNT_0048228655 /DNA_START=33 /DNA_END=581 /DNA_ORIENTATION=+